MMKIQYVNTAGVLFDGRVWLSTTRVTTFKQCFFLYFSTEYGRQYDYKLCLLHPLSYSLDIQKQDQTNVNKNNILTY